MKLEMLQVQETPRFTRGYYYTEYGNVAYVSGPHAKTAKDLDMNECIPITMVTTERATRAK